MRDKISAIGMRTKSMTPVGHMCGLVALLVVVSGGCVVCRDCGGRLPDPPVKATADPPPKPTPTSMFFVASVSVRGLRQVTTESIRGAIHIRPGAQANRLDVDADVQRLLALNLFTDVKADLEGAATGGLVVIFSVFEK